MRKMKAKGIVTWTYIAMFVSIFCIYILPTYYMDSIGFPVASIIFGAFLMLSIIFLIFNHIKISLLELIYMCLIVTSCIYQKNINPIILLSPVVVKHYITFNIYDEIKYFLLQSKTIDMALVMTVIYSIVYGISSGRFLHTGIYEVNSSGLAVLILGLIYLKRNKILGYSVLTFGCLSLSRNYFLAIAFIILFFKSRRIREVVGKVYKNLIFKFIILMLITAIVLYLIGVLAQNKYLNNEIIYETTLWGRLTNFFDSSNYFRFTINVILINVFMLNPIYWFVGCNSSEFTSLCYEYARKNGYWYRGNNPHNFVFSYIKLYGLAGIIDMLIISKIISKIVNKNNFILYMVFILYSIFLSVGFNGEWLFMVVAVLILYNEDTYQLYKK